jgi:hypothetical protein
VPVARFVGTWVGTQARAIAIPPPGVRQDQPVTLTIESVDGKMTGTMRPFLGGEEGATFTEVAIVGEELHATAVVSEARQGRAGRGWKDPIRVAFVLRYDGVLMKGRPT